MNPIEPKIMSDMSSLTNKLHIVTKLFHFSEIFSDIVGYHFSLILSQPSNLKRIFENDVQGCTHFSQQFQTPKTIY